MTTPTLPPADAIPLGQAVQAAYLAFAGKPYTAPTGWTFVASVSGWDDIIWKIGRVESFALVFKNDAGQYLVAIRGTSSDTDLYDDVWIDTKTFVAHGGSSPPAPTVAAGFYGIYTGKGGTMTESMQDQLWALIATYGISNLVITGHSLGGALAQLFAFDVAVSAPSMTVQTVTFAAPMVGKADWAQDYAASVTDSVSVVNQYDLVPALPSSHLGLDYQPVGTPFDIAFERSTIGWNPADDVLIRHEMDNYLTVVTNILDTGAAPWLGQFPDGVFAGVQVESYAPSGEGAQVVAAELARRSTRAESA